MAGRFRCSARAATAQSAVVEPRTAKIPSVRPSARLSAIFFRSDALAQKLENRLFCRFWS
jgi:hypothetical protein